MIELDAISGPDRSRSQGLDEIDVGLIALLQQDGRTPLTDLGAKLGVSHGTVRNRLDRLVKQQVIKIIAVVDPARVGLSTLVYIGINADLKSIETIEEQLSQFPEVNYVSTMSGQFDFLVGAVFASDAHLREFLIRKLSKVRGIRSTETLHVLNLVKRVWQWQVPVSNDEKPL